MNFSEQEQEVLIQLVKDSIHYGLQYHQVMLVDLSDYPFSLRENKASFVTLHVAEELRGCIGSLEAYQPLVQDVVHNAFAAAFQDPRFYPITSSDLPQLRIHISVLNEPEPLFFQTEQEVVDQLRPGIDGLIFTDKGHKGTFLPSVWESFSDPQIFLNHLKMKAGFDAHYWSDHVKIKRYTVTSLKN